ncbi:3-methyl-2-oxobutanoate hydroxymethyltransferase [Allohahella sp. A8]|uniref:3-methyl-2-oxobutanoate hydroxymethyltransferase n=1 Tax=Allohahella sp. A8 TaxID=3141461 RepID=UPI003A7F8CB1
MSGPRITLSRLKKMAADRERIAVLTAYDAMFARTAELAGVEVLLIGDSLGMVLQGKESTVPVTTADIAYHTECVARGSQTAFIMADMPFMTYNDAASACRDAATLMRAGAHMVKLEGTGWLADVVAQLSRQGVPVCAHLGLTPQSVHKFGGYKVQGKTAKAADAMLQDAHALVEAGADMLLLECVPPDLARRITESVAVPVVGIGAGADTDAQVLVMHDMLGLGERKPAKFVRNFMDGSDSIQQAIERYVQAVKDGSFPASEHCFAEVES